MTDLTQARLKELLHYDPETGIWTNRVDRHYRALAGEVAGFINNKGYRILKVDGQAYLSSRLAFLYQTGEWPPNEADHKRHDTQDDRWEALRVATREQNVWNKRGAHLGRTLPKGVHQHCGKWIAEITVRSKRKHLGAYDTPEQAAIAYNQAATEAFGEFAYLNAVEDQDVQRRVKHLALGASGKRGVCLYRGKWRAQRYDPATKKQHYVGSFLTLEAAAEAHDNARLQ